MPRTYYLSTYENYNFRWREINYSEDLNAPRSWVCVTAPSLASLPVIANTGQLSQLYAGLPDGVAWQGAYYAGAVSDTVNDVTLYLLGYTPHQTPMAANAEALNWIQTQGDELGLTLKLMPIYCDDAAQLNSDGHGFVTPSRERITGTASLTTTTHGEVLIASSCSKCGFPGHNSRTCDAKEDIDLVGIEIEGRWARGNWATVVNKASALGATHCGDGSVRRVSGYENQEFQTKPTPLAGALRQLVSLYPDHTGKDCGMHVHVSFKCETYFTILSTPEFFAYFARRWNEWGTAQGLDPNSEFFRRLRGENNYCLPNTDARSVYTQDRYLQLNFSAWSEHKTVECRLLPMFRDKTLAVAAVTHLIQIFKDWIATDSVALALPEENFNDPAATADFGKAFSTDMSLPIDFLTVIPNHDVTSIELAPILPPAEGMRRIAVSPAGLATLQNLLAA